jgi:hypothetical protein
MQAEEQGRTPFGSVDLDQFPQRSGAIEGALVHRTERVEEFGQLVLRRNPGVVRVAAHVKLEVEGRIGLPARKREIEGRVHHALAQARHHLDGPQRTRPQLLRLRRPVEQHEHRHGVSLARLVAVPPVEIFGGERFSRTTSGDGWDKRMPLSRGIAGVPIQPVTRHLHGAG